MKTIEIKGTIIVDEYKEIYEFYGYESFCPKDLLEKMPQNGEDVEIIINSGGGHVLASQEIYSHLKSYEGHVTAKVFSLAASSASIIAMGADKVLMSPVSQIMIHNVSGGTEGDYHVMEKEAETLKAFNKAIATAYTMKTGKSEEEILELMDKETWLNAKDAVEMGFADEILFEEKKMLVANGTTMLPEAAVNKARAMMAKSNTTDSSVTKEDFETFKNEILNIIKPQPTEPKQEPQQNKIKTGLYL